MTFKVIGVGEVLWDLLPTGSQLGGAPANFACHARALGAQAAVVTRVGNDSFGRTILQRFEQMGITDGTVQVDDEAPTGSVTVALSDDGIAHFTIHENVAWDRLAVTPEGLNAVREADAICFGSLAQRSDPARTSVQRLVTAAQPGALRVFDINLRQNYFSGEIIEQSLRLANVLKLNDGELSILAQLFGLAGSPGKFELRLVALTRGPAGSLLFQAGQWSDRLSIPVEVVDTVGAGDAFTAALVLGLLQKKELDEINALASEVARYVCSCAGATPPLPKTICDRFITRDSVLNTQPEKVPAA
jgi:fructokinase